MLNKSFQLYEYDNARNRQPSAGISKHSLHVNTYAIKDVGAPNYVHIKNQ